MNESEFERGYQRGVEDAARVTESHNEKHRYDSSGMVHSGHCHQAIAKDIRALATGPAPQSEYQRGTYGAELGNNDYTVEGEREK